MNKSKYQGALVKLIACVVIFETILLGNGFTKNVFAAVNTNSNTEDTRVFAGKPGRDELVEPVTEFYDEDGDSIEEILDVKYIPELKDIPHLRNQDRFGCCYSFATIGAIEANAIKKGISQNAIDGSELALAYFTSHTVNDPLGGGEGDSNKYNPAGLIREEKNGIVYGLEGGNPCFTSAAVANWTGVTAEEKVPYTGTKEDLETPVYVDAKYAYDDILHVTGWHTTDVGITFSRNYDEFIANRKTLKHMIKEFGGATIAYAANSSLYLGSDGHSYYNHVDTNLNHFVTVIGWDDNYDKNNFDYDYARPEGNGAWLCKNSWSNDDFAGTSVDDNLDITKLFYISYYDTSIVDAYAFDVEYYDNYDNNYQYDLALGSYYLNQFEDTATAANVFTVHGNEDGTELLEAVSFETNGTTNQEYEINIYRNPDLSEGDPTNGDLIAEATTTGKTTYAGYYTVPLDNSVLFDQEETFSVVITFTKEGGNPGFAIEHSNYMRNPEYWFISEIGIKPNTSFYTDEEGSWCDLYDEYISSQRKYGNVKIKAFTKNADYTESLDSVEITHKEDAIPPRVGSEISKTDFEVTKTITRTNINDGSTETLSEKITNKEYANVTIDPETVPMDAKDKLSVNVTFKQGLVEKTETIEIAINNEPEPDPNPENPNEDTARRYRLRYNDDPVTYTGKPIKIPVALYYGDELLTEKKDYTVKYYNNINVGTHDSDNPPYLIVKGKGNHAISYKIKFDIEKKNISENDIKYSPIAIQHGKSVPERPVPAITYQKKKIKANDMRLLYLDANKNPISGNKLPADAYGLYYVNVTGKNNYTSNVDIPIHIGTNLMSKAKVTIYSDSSMTNKAKSFAYTGQEIKPALTVTIKAGGVNKELVEGVDFECKYADNVEIGTATVSIIGKNVKEFAGEKKVTFKITGDAINKAAKLNILSDRNFVYDGKAKNLDYTIIRKDSSDKLREGVDYTVISANNINKGNASLTIVGIGKYHGKINVKYKIGVASENLVEAKIQASEYGYTKGGVKPKPLVTYKDMTLIEGRDYTLSYKNNKNIASMSDANPPICIVKFKGNYSGTKTLPFTIVSKNLKQIDAYAAPIFGADATVDDVRVALTDTDGIQLSAGTDYTVDGCYLDRACTTLVESSKKLCEENGIDRFYVKFAGQGSYTGSTVAECKVCGWFMKNSTRNYYYADLSKTMIVLNDIQYDGNKTEPSVKTLVKKAIATVESYDEQYDEYSSRNANITDSIEEYCKIISFSNNSKKGTATVVIEGTGLFAGRQVLTFKIVDAYNEN